MDPRRSLPTPRYGPPSESPSPCEPDKAPDRVRPRTCSQAADGDRCFGREGSSSILSQSLERWTSRVLVSPT